jgi:hypothetical protein
VSHPRGSANTTGMHRHLDDLLRDVRRLASVGGLEEKRAPTLRARAAPVALLAFRRGAMPDDIGPAAIGTVEHVGHQRFPLSQCYGSVRR